MSKPLNKRKVPLLKLFWRGLCLESIFISTNKVRIYIIGKLWTGDSQPVVRVPLLVHEGLSGGTRVTSIFSQKPGFTAFYFTYRALFLNKSIFL